MNNVTTRLLTNANLVVEENGMTLPCDTMQKTLAKPSEKGDMTHG